MVAVAAPAGILQCEYRRQRTDPHSTRSVGYVNGGCGFPLRGVLFEQYTGLDGRDYRTFVDLRSSSMIRFEVRLTP